MKRNVLVIVGPTASGKSTLAVQVAKKLDGEIISADSRQIYRGLNIGTGKITKKETLGVPHHMIDIVSPKKVYTAAEYIQQGRIVIDDILSRKKLPIICGGTGFYIDALVGRIDLPDVPPNPKLRERLEKMSAEKLFAMLEKKDPVRAKSIDRHNPVRLVRALEIAAQQRPKTTQDNILTSRYHLETTWIGIAPSLEVLLDKIHIRLKSRMKSGMLAEAKKLHTEGISWKRMNQLGLEYRYMALHLQGKISKAEMLQELELRIYQYAKRQITYWKRNKEIRWFSSAKDAYRFIKSETVA